MQNPSWNPQLPKWPWKDFLTAEEQIALQRADAAKAEWQRLNAERAAITNRAIQRAKYNARRAAALVPAKDGEK